MRRYKCQRCDAVVRRGSFCSHCGARQPPRIVRGAFAVIGTTAVVAVFAAAFGSLGKTMPEFRPPRPSGAAWASEADIGPLDLVPGAPSPFAPTTAPCQGEGEGKATSQP
jgi:hypothetical protein